MEKVQETFLVFENQKNNCWLDAALSLIVHNRTFKKLVNGFPKSQINYIIAKHEEAVTILNNASNNNIEEKINKTKAILVKIQQSTLQYLQTFSNFKEGEPDSAFCALLNLILQDKSNLKEQLLANWFWNKQCTNCGNSSKYDPPMKPIITLPKVKSFQPQCPSAFYTCACKTEQEMKLTYKVLPACLIFHFEKGAGDEENFPVFFSLEERKYHLTAVVVLEKSADPNLNHFVTYIRERSLNLWLDCNDLNCNIVSFSFKQPEFALKDVCMYVFEAFDNFGKITSSVSSDTDQSVDNLHIEFIDLASEVEEVKPSSEDEDHTPSKLFQGVKKEESLLTSKELVEYAIKSASKKENETISTSNLPLKKAIKERQLNVMPVDSEESDKSDINSDMMPVGSRFSFQKVEAKNSLDSALLARKSESCVIKEKNGETKNLETKAQEERFGDKDINASFESKNKEQNDLQSLTGISASSSQNFERNASTVNSSSKANSHAKPSVEPKPNSVNSVAHISKSDAYLSVHGLEFIMAQRRSEDLFKKSQLGLFKNEPKCVRDRKSEVSSVISNLKEVLDGKDILLKTCADNTQPKLESEQKDSVPANAVVQTSTLTGKSVIGECSQQASAEKSGVAKLFASNSKHVHDETKNSNLKVAPEKQDNTMSPSGIAESESEYGEKELLLKTKKTSLKGKKNEIAASGSNKKSKTVVARKEASNSGSAEANDEVKPAVRKSSRISSQPKKVKWSKTVEPEEASNSPDRERRRQKYAGKTRSDESIEKKVRKIAEDVVECTFASFIEQICLRQENLL